MDGIYSEEALPGSSSNLERRCFVPVGANAGRRQCLGIAADVVEPLHPSASLLTVPPMNAGASVLRVARILFVAALALFMLPSCAKYDELVEKDQVAQEKWSNLEANLQRRAELIPNLVSTVKASANYEKETLDKITQARASATSIKLSADDLTDPAKVKAFQDAQDKLSSSSISRLLVSNENYPKLQASGQFTDLMKQLEGTENRILRAREEYNASVRAYNAELLKIRGTVVNKATGQPFKPRVFFSASTESQAPPKVSF
jgi:LemA protein